MGFFTDVFEGVAAPISKQATGNRTTDGDYHALKQQAFEEAANDRGLRVGSVSKQSVDRRASLPDAVADALDDIDAADKPYDPTLLRDLSESPIPQTYIDTLSQDAASANWHIRPSDENTEVDDATIADYERRTRELPPESPFRDVLEGISRTLLQLGDSTLVKHYPGGDPENEVAEIVHVDSATMYKVLDEHGFTEGYVQVYGTGRGDFDVTVFEKGEVVWFSWGTRPDDRYGMGPVEKGQDTIEILEEIGDKELLDLIQGMPPGIVSRPPDEEFPVDSDDWENFKEDMRLGEGERHRLAYTQFPVEYTPLSPNYQDLQLLDRYTSKVTELGGVFKVNPSYAGFDFENINRATDESQRQAYKQRGFTVLLRQLEAGINAGLIWPEFGEDVVFEFEREQSVAEQREKANTILDAVTAGKEAADAGLQVTWKDGLPQIEDGTMNAGNAGASEGGGLFMDAVGGPEQTEHAVSLVEDGGTGNLNADALNGKGVHSFDTEKEKAEGDDGPLSKEEALRLDETLFNAHREQIYPESLDDIEKRIWTTDNAVPDYVVSKIRDAIDAGAVFDKIQSAEGRFSEVREALEDILEENLTRSSGWSLKTVTDDIRDAFGNLSEGEAERIARSETASVLNKSRELGYEERDDAATLKFAWVGPDDSRTTPACERLKELTNPKYGGNPVAMPELKRLERQVHAEFFPDLDYREHNLHIHERHTFRRVLSNETPATTNSPGTNA